MERTHQYDDILHLPHHVSETRPHMPLIDRAAQFSPFAALTGYDDAIDETARRTDEKRELTEERQKFIGAQLRALQDFQHSAPEVEVTFFVPDAKKAGGAYRTLRDSVRRVDPVGGVLELAGGAMIPFDDILSIDEPPEEGK